ncbi:flippase [Bacillus canaveralius]|uniref:Flippase n=1 Tax=Bacillus canaveralius TaxID=1403243 RepID=A0A2N5GMH5_9BACI|nr:flippase [Bacillus canaveralius]PLR83137.1 flippase [Bacillus canaveralius]PLR94055.1 flippase [Bacillus canaveralius]RSK54144.1 flippase [Bacillus canaveralius]
MSTKKRLITNFLSLASVQGLNFILPLITLPYLLLVLGPAKFGLISFAQALIQYFMIFTDYGFNLVATKEIALNRENNKKVSVIFSSVMVVKIVLLLLCLLVLFILVQFVPKFQSDGIIYYYTFGMVIGNVLFPVWFFQGMEHMKVISILNILSKTIFTISIFVFVKDSSQFLYVPIFNSLGYMMIGLIGFYMVLFRYKIRFAWPSKAEILFQLKEGRDIFISTIMTSLYTTSNTFILGFFASNTVVGYFSSAERVIRALTSVVAPLVQTVYPFLSKALHESQQRGLWILNRLFYLVTFSMGTLSIIIGLFANDLVNLFLGPEYAASVPLMQILSPLPLIIGWANIFSTLTMVTFDYKKQLSFVYIAASTLSVLLMFILIPTFREYGTAWIALITEIVATLLMAVFLWRKGIKVWKWQKQT